MKAATNRLTFLGATETVTGSKYLIETANYKLLVDCGLFQGYKSLRLRNWEEFPFNSAELDAIFAEAMASLEEIAAIRKAVDIPILANMTEFGKSDLFGVSELEKIGVNIVIYPVSLLRAAMGAAERALKTLKADGSLEAEVESMQTRSRLYELLDYKNYEAFDNSVFNFKLRKDQ